MRKLGRLWQGLERIPQRLFMYGWNRTDVDGEQRRAGLSLDAGLEVTEKRQLSTDLFELQDFLLEVFLAVPQALKLRTYPVELPIGFLQIQCRKLPDFQRFCQIPRQSSAGTPGRVGQAQKRLNPPSGFRYLGLRSRRRYGCQAFRG